MNRTISAILLTVLLICSRAQTENTSIGSVATEDDMTDVIDIIPDDAVPVTPIMLNDGIYQISVDVSSPMFKVVDCSLTVSEGAMTAKLYMKSKAYSYMFVGTAEAAAETDISKLIPLREDTAGSFFELPVDSLDTGYTCAALSERKQLWYPRTLVFRSDSLPLEAFRYEYLNTAESLELENGQYECEVTL